LAVASLSLQGVANIEWLAKYYIMKNKIAADLYRWWCRADGDSISLDVFTNDIVWRRTGGGGMEGEAVALSYRIDKRAAVGTNNIPSRILNIAWHQINVVREKIRDVDMTKEANPLTVFLLCGE
jgi:hypothetical protein